MCSSYMTMWVIPIPVQARGFGAAEHQFLSWNGYIPKQLEDIGIGSLPIVEARGFGTAEMPILQIVWVYSLKRGKDGRTNTNT